MSGSGCSTEGEHRGVCSETDASEDDFQCLWNVSLYKLIRRRGQWK